MENNSSVLSLMLSSLGWILLVVMTAVFFFFGQNYYYQMGLADGKAFQLQEDIAKVDQQLGGAISTGPQTQVTATVKAINGNTLQVNAINQSPNPLGAANFIEERTILITGDTQIVLQVPKDPQVYAQEIEAARQDNTSGQIIALQPFTEEIVSLDKIQLESTIVVQGVNQEDLSKMSEITASLVYLISEELTQ